MDTNSTFTEFLEKIAPFDQLTEDELRDISVNITVEPLARDTVMFVQGQSLIEAVYIVRRGKLELFYNEHGKETVKGYLNSGEHIGGIAILCNNSVPIRTVRVVEDTLIYRLPKKLFLNLCAANANFAQYFSNAFDHRMLDKSYAVIREKGFRKRQRSDLSLMNLQINEIARKSFAYCDATETVEQAARLMNRESSSCILVRDEKQNFTGIITDKDFRTKVVASGVSGKSKVGKIMSTPLFTIEKDALIFEGIQEMLNRNVKHLALTDTDGQVVGVISNDRLLSTQMISPVILIREINQTQKVEDLFKKHSRLPGLVRNLASQGAKAENITRMITAVSDAILKKVIAFALEEFDEPPVPWAFVIMGSEGRREQTLMTDQDNAIIFKDVPKKDLDKTQKYFLRLGKKICGWLNDAGYTYCNGDVMAQNPKWCQPLAKWKRYFSVWVETPEPMAVMQSSIFFDFRGAWGEFEMVDELRKYLMSLMDKRAGLFYYHLTKNALQMKPPLGFFKNFVVESKGEHRDALDIKKAMTTIVDFARIYSLENRITETNTLERLNALHLKKVLKYAEFHDLTQAYTFMLQSRYMRQIRAILDENTKPDNYINPDLLGGMERKLLKEIFIMIQKFQQKMSVHFTGLQ